MSFAPRRLPRQETVTVRGLAHRVLRWGPESPDPLVLLHGWGDTSDSFQFVADEIGEDWPLAAFDWRGFGGSARPADGYWFPDYFADLEAMLERLCGGRKARLVGHSMGGNIAMAYAGARPERVRAVLNLEGVGLPRTDPSQAPARLAQWLDELRRGWEPGDYPDAAALADRLQKRNPRLARDRALWIAGRWAEPRPGGGVRLRADPRHRQVNPTLYRRDEQEACWKAISAPVRLVIGAESELPARLGADADPDRLKALVPGLQVTVMAGAGHMLHHEQPAALARLIEDFFGEP